MSADDVLRNLGVLAEAYEAVASGTSPTGNYYFSVNAAEAAASVRAAMAMIPRWIPIEERQPINHEQCLVAKEEYVGLAFWHSRPKRFIHEDIDNDWTPTHWIQLPEPPENALDR